MSMTGSSRGTRVLTVALVAYALASLAHFVHNGVFLDAYPNMPEWLSASGVYGAWLLVTAVGVAGYWLLRRGRAVAGSIVIAAYALLGFAGLDHYALAPPSAHTLAMNLTIWSEVIAASVVLLVLATISLRRATLAASSAGDR